MTIRDNIKYGYGALATARDSLAAAKRDAACVNSGINKLVRELKKELHHIVSDDRKTTFRVHVRRSNVFGESAVPSVSGDVLYVDVSRWTSEWIKGGNGYYNVNKPSTADELDVIRLMGAQLEQLGFDVTTHGVINHGNIVVWRLPI